MDRFSLLRLPTVALKEVLKCFTPIELYHLSECSRNMAQLIPLAGTKKVSLEVNIEHLTITMNKKYRIQFENHYPKYFKEDPNTLLLILQDKSNTEMIDRLKRLCFSISALFKCPIKTLEIRRSVSTEQCLSIIEEFQTFQKTRLENLYIDGNFKNKDLKWILENANVTGYFILLMENVQNFSIDLKLNCRRFALDHARWLTVDNLVSLTSCKTISLSETNLTIQDLNIFMEKWKSGGLPNLEYLRVVINLLEDDGQVFGFSRRQLITFKSFERRKIVDNQYIDTSSVGVDVVNDDGIKGTIQMVHDMFQFFVWKD